MSKKAYIINNSSGSRLRFQYNPTKIPYSRGVNFSEIKSPGMSYPLTQYVNGEAREFTFELFMYDDPCTGKIDRARKFLERLMPPEKNRSGFRKPPTFTIAYGYFVKSCVLKKLEVDDDRLDSYGRPVVTTFKITARQVG